MVTIFLLFLQPVAKVKLFYDYLKMNAKKKCQFYRPFIHGTYPIVFFMGHKQSVQNQIRRHRRQRLIRFYTLCLQNVLLKFQGNNLLPNNP